MPYHYLVLRAGITASVTDDVLTVDVGYRAVSFRGQSRAVLQRWADAILQPQAHVNDNAMFYELENVSQQESFKTSVSDVNYMIDCIKFNNMVKNRYDYSTIIFFL